MKGINIKNRDGEVDVRDDEDQEVKLAEIIQLLVAAGYFRARIKGLPPFDKIVGGMTWCIEICNFDVDVDLLFNENLTLGQKIALTERIVTTLPRMKCPHLIEPHQIQGLDAIRIFPVIQWLVKKGLETKAEYNDYNRQYSVAQYHRNFTTPLHEKVKENSDYSSQYISDVQSHFAPKRQWRRKQSITKCSLSENVQLTLLEYGQFGSSILQGGNADQTDSIEERAEVDGMMKKLHEADTANEKLSTAQVGNIVSGGAEEIIAASKRFSQLQENIQDEVLGDSVSAQIKKLAKLENQREKLIRQSESIHADYKKVTDDCKDLEKELKELKETTSNLNSEIDKLKDIDSEENKELAIKIANLVRTNEAARKNEAKFKENCRGQAEKLKEEISEIEKQLDECDINDDLAQKCTSERERYLKMRRQLAKKTRKVEALKRSIDDIPGRAELSQYQRRFVELYNQIGAAHRETGQFYNMYNSLTDSRTYMEKELTLLNSILDNMSVAVGNNNTLEEFIHQLEGIVDGIKQNKMKLEQKRAEEKAYKSGLVTELSHLQELSRQYATTVHLLSQEINKNEALHLKLDNL